MIYGVGWGGVGWGGVGRCMIYGVGWGGEVHDIWGGVSRVRQGIPSFLNRWGMLGGGGVLTILNKMSRALF